MKIDKPENENYSATVVRLKNIIPLEGMDNVVATTIFGFQAIVSKASQVGDIGLIFPAETQLSDEFCYNNNLYRHGDKNKVEDVKGYIEDNRRVKAVKFRGNISSCLFVGLDSLSYLGINLNDLVEGDTFDRLDGKEICTKYVVERKGHLGGKQAKKEKFTRVEAMFMPEHPDTGNFFRLRDTMQDNWDVIVTQKLHGTSVRIGNTVVRRELNIFEKLLKKVGFKIQEFEYDYIFGSRKVIKDPNNPNHNHFYSFDLWNEEGKKLMGILPENYLVFGEIIGYVGAEDESKEIQKNYTYDHKVGTRTMYIYRIAIVNPKGHLTDLTWDQLVEFCTKNGLNYVPELWRGKLKKFKPEDYLDKRFFEEGYRNCLSLGSNKELVDEGVCVRVDGLEPKIFKAKSPKFLLHETQLLDQNVEDLESTQVDSEGEQL